MLTPEAFMEQPTDEPVALSWAGSGIVCFEALIGPCVGRRNSLFYDMSGFMAGLHL